MSNKFRFYDLDVWQKAIRYINLIYQTTKSFPPDERFGLTSQLRRAGVSVASNIAEGSGRSTDADFARFVEIAYGSLMETVSHCYIAKDQSFLELEQFEQLSNLAAELARMLSGLRSRLRQ